MSEQNNSVKFTISMEQDLRDWVDAKVVEMNRKDRRLKTSRSAIIADAVQSMRENEEQGKAQSPDNATNVDTKIVKPYKRSAGGSSTRGTSVYRKAG